MASPSTPTGSQEQSNGQRGLNESGTLKKLWPLRRPRVESAKSRDGWFSNVIDRLEVDAAKLETVLGEGNFQVVPRGDRVVIKTPKPLTNKQKSDIRPSSQTGWQPEDHAVPGILIAIDFGTACSSIAYMYTKGFYPETRLIREWPGIYESSEWAPTIIRYDEPEPYKWGYQIEEGDSRYEWFKLGLSPTLLNSGLALQYPSRTALPFVTGPECEKLVTDYLRGLQEHAEQYLKMKSGHDVMKNNKSQYIITVPAVWSEKAQDTIKSCAENAGMGIKTDVLLVTEPEAAGIYTLNNMMLPVRVDDTFVLCAAGGGTVELISYTVRDVGDQRVIYESACGTGDTCGSTFLNRIFDQRLRNRFSNFPQWDAGYHNEAMYRFETKIKREFNGNKTKNFTVPARGLRDNPSVGIKGGQVQISGTELDEIFELVIHKVLALVTAQIRDTPKPVKAVLLAGGFGQSKYLCERLKKAVAPVQVIQIEDSATAIVRGALLCGIAEKTPGLTGSIKVDGRMARRHCGIKAWIPYDPRLHADSSLGKRAQDMFRGGVIIEVMNWMVRKGDLVRESKPVFCPFYWDRKISEGRPTVIFISLYKCDDIQNKGAPKYPDDPEVQKFVELQADLTSIPESTFKREFDTYGEMSYKMELMIEMTYRSGGLKFTLVHNGQRYDTIDQKFD